MSMKINTASYQKPKQIEWTNWSNRNTLMD